MVAWLLPEWKVERMVIMYYDQFNRPSIRPSVHLSAVAIDPRESNHLPPLIPRALDSSILSCITSQA